MLHARSSHLSCSVKKVFLEILQNSQENICVRVSILIKLQASVTVCLNKKYQHFQKVNTNYKEIVSFHRQKLCWDVEMNIKCLWITYWYAILKWKRLLDFNRSFRRYITIGHNNAVYCFCPQATRRRSDVAVTSQMKHPTTPPWNLAKTSQWYVSTKSY